MAEFQDTAQDVNPITVQIIRHNLVAIPKQIEINITRTAYSPLVYEYKDYAVGIVSADGRLVSESEGGVPLFVANALGNAVQDGLKIHGAENMRPGDVFFTNHAGTLGQHLNNVAMYAPIFVGPDQSDLIGFFSVLVHWIDIGGMAAGMPIGTTEIFQEGIQFRSVKIVSQGKVIQDIYRTIECNTRFPQQLMGDINAQIAGCTEGRDLTARLVEKYGAPIFRAAVQLNWDRSESVARDAVRSLPNGVYRASSFMDNDGLDYDKQVRIEVVVTIKDDEMNVDFSGLSEQVRGSINSGAMGGAITAARIAFKYLAAPDDAANDGTFRPLTVTIPDGKFLSASANSAKAMYMIPLPTVIDTIMRAMVQAAPDRLAAGHHGNFAVHSLEGKDPVTGKSFFSLVSGMGGWGATQQCDGPGPFRTMSHGDTLDIPVEVQEALYPIRIDESKLVEDSGGVGTFRGGLGIQKTFTALAPCRVLLDVERTGCPPWGVLGGKDARPADVHVDHIDGSRTKKLKGAVPLAAGDQVVVRTSGGGGFGDPRKRSIAMVTNDVRRGYVSVDRARTEYLVDIDADGQVNEKSTADLRNA